MDWPTKDQMVYLYTNQQMSTTKIGALLDRSKRSVLAYIKKLGIPLRKRRTLNTSYVLPGPPEKYRMDGHPDESWPVESIVQWVRGGGIVKSLPGGIRRRYLSWVMKQWHNTPSGKQSRATYRESEKRKEHFKRWQEKRVKSGEYNKYKRAYRRNLRDQIIKGYGGKCCCCGETTYEFLTVDHIIKGDKAKHRLKFGAESSITFYRWIIREGYPSSLRILCFNCNCSIGVFGYCPHHPNGLT